MNNNVKCLMCIMALPYKGLFKDKCPFHGGFLFVSYLNLHPWLPDPNNHIKANEYNGMLLRMNNLFLAKCVTQPSDALFDSNWINVIYW